MRTKKSPVVENWISQIHQSLQTIMRRKRGEVRRVESQMGVKDGYWRAARARGALDGIALLRALEILGIDPRIFFIAAIGGQVGPGIFEAEFIHSAGISEEEVKRLLNDEG